MKRLICLMILIVAAMTIGCESERRLSPSGGRGLTDTQHERHRRAFHIVDLQNRMLQDDWDMVWLFDRSTRLTEWHVYINE